MLSRAQLGGGVLVPTWPGPRLAWAPRPSSQARPLSLGPARRERGLRGRLLRAAGLGARPPRRVPSAEWPTWAPSERTCTTRAIPREIATHPFFFFAALFSDVFFCFVSFWRAE